MTEVVRRPQLDSVRAFAVLLVLCQHTMRPQLLLTGDAGAIGVTLFLVLSGFLITGILLDARRDAEALGASRREVLRRFYIRRFLRIFPLYYAVIAIAWLLWEPTVRQQIAWLLLYGTNFLMASLGRNIGMATPFWSLAVEEQFYLVWPLVVLFCARRHLPWVLTGMIVLSVVSRFVIARTGAPMQTITMLTWSALDALAIGGMLALAHRSDRDSSHALRWVLIGGLVLIAVRLAMIGNHVSRPIQMTIWMLPWAMVSVWIVDRAAHGRLPVLFNWRPLAWMGVISYGVYIYHRPLMSVFSIGARRGWDVFLFITLATLVVASVSWLAFERPINNLKHRWPYVRVPKPIQVASVVVTEDGVGRRWRATRRRTVKTVGR